MCDKRTRWIHCYLQYFIHFQCSLHGHADSQIFIANLRQKNHQIFKTCISWGFRALFVKKLFKLFFRFRLVNLSGWGGGGDDNVPWTCTHAWCYANWWLRDVNILWTCIHLDATQMCTHVWCYTQMCTHVWTTQIGFFGMLTFLDLAHMFDATQIGFFGMLTLIPWTCTHVWCYANWWLRAVNIPWACTHAWCYANWGLRDVNIPWTCIHLDATQIGFFGMLTLIPWTCTHVWCYANVQTCLMLRKLVSSGC